MRISFKAFLGIVFMFAWLVLFCSGLISCGARKAHKEREKESITTYLVDKSTSETKVDIKKESESNVKRSEEVIVNNQDQTITSRKTVEPIDSSKPASYKGEDGKVQELNNSKITTETTTKNNNTKSESKINTDKSEKKSTDSIAQEKKNNDIVAKSDSERSKSLIDVKRDQFSSWYIIIFIGVVALILWGLKKYTKIFG